MYTKLNELEASRYSEDEVTRLIGRHMFGLIVEPKGFAEELWALIACPNYFIQGLV